MLPRAERLRYSGLFEQARQQGKKFRSKNLYIFMTRTREAYSQALPFVGFAISKNYSKLAVKRNHIKRQLREIYRHYRQPENKKTSLKNIGLLVIGVIPQGSSVPYASLKSELETLLDNGLQYYCDLYN